MPRTDAVQEKQGPRLVIPEGHDLDLQPEPAVRELIPLLQERGAAEVLDLGCGAGRHARLLADEGFRVQATDVREAGLRDLRRQSRLGGSNLKVHCGPLTDLPFEDASMDYVLAWRTVYRGDLSAVLRVLSEVYRVLRRGGLFQCTMLSKRNSFYGYGTELSANTYVLEGARDRERPHFYCNAAELVALLSGFELLRLEDVALGKPGAYHWLLLAEKT